MYCLDCGKTVNQAYNEANLMFLGIGLECARYSGDGSITLRTNTNNPPNKPTKPSGPTSLQPRYSGKFTTSATDPEGSSLVYQWAWDFKGDTQEHYGLSTMHPTLANWDESSEYHCWQDNGTYIVKVRAKDSDGMIGPWSDGFSVTVGSGSSTPTVLINGPYTGKVNTAVSLSASASGGSSPYAYTWDLDNDGQYDDGSGSSVSKTWSAAGTYTISVKVTDSTSKTDTDATTVTITTNTLPLTAEAGGSYSGNVGDTIQLSGSATGGTQPYSYAWDLDNDGQYDDEG
jgi:hypothetical protein